METKKRKSEHMIAKKEDAKVPGESTKTDGVVNCLDGQDN